MLVQFAHALPSVPGTQTPTPFMSWHDWPVRHELAWFTSQRARQTVAVLPTQARPAPQAASVLPRIPQASPSEAISSLHAHTPVEKHAVHAPGAMGLHAARHRPAEHIRPWAHMVPLQGWQVEGALVPGKQTLEAPADSVAQVSVTPHVLLGHAVQKPPAPLPAQQPRQYDSGLAALSRVHTLQPLQTSETVQGSPVFPRGVHVPVVHRYPVGHSLAVVHWLVHVIELGTQKPSGIWQV